jgi:endoglucanase Acf2
MSIPHPIQTIMRPSKSTRLFSVILTTLLLLILHFDSNAQSVPVGQGSYTTSLPSGANGPLTSDGQPAIPKISDEFDQLITTNDFWSSLIYPYQNGDHSNIIPAHPLKIEASASGFEIGYSSNFTIAGSQYIDPANYQLEISIDGLAASKTTTNSYGDWTFSAKMEYENASLIATTGHGLPYTYFDVNGGDIEISSPSTISIWHNVDEVLGITVDGVHYGLFAPAGSSWSGTETLSSSLNDKQYIAVALLPDATTETLELFRTHAYAQVTNSSVSWEYNESTSYLISTFSYETRLRDSTEGNSSETITALYRHQWLNTTNALTNHTYQSPRGEMKVYVGNTFSTRQRFSGILPALPDVGDYDKIQLIEYIKEVTDEQLTAGDTYNNGKKLGRFSDLVHLADQLGATAERDYFLDEIKNRLEDWFTAGGAQQYYYNDTWDVLTGYPASFGSDVNINDHHFHSAYAIKAAATIAQYDSTWAAQENWGGMVNLLIRDANSWNRNDEMFPFLRSFDPYAGHAWASGHGDFENLGNNQESSSESMNFATASILWGEMTGQEEIRDLGIFLYTNESEAIAQYWFDVDEQVFPTDYPYDAVGIVWGTGGNHGTWFGNDPEFIHGINLLPVHAGSFYHAKNRDYIITNYNNVVEERGSQPIHWKDVFWQYLAMADADLAISYYEADQNYDPFDGESRAHTMHWLYNMKTLGHFSTEITADVPVYSVFVNEQSDTTYIAYNAQGTERLVTYSDGFEMLVPPNAMFTHHTGDQTSSIPAAPDPEIAAENIRSVFSDTYPSAVDADFKPNEGQNTVTSIVNLAGNLALKFQNLDFQSIHLDVPLNVASQTTFHLDYYSEGSSSLRVTLEDTDENAADFDLTIADSDWQPTQILLSDFPDSFNLNRVSKITFEGDGTVYIDNIFFSGDSPILDGPLDAAPNPVSVAEHVLSIFSDAYDDVAGTNFNPDWGQETKVTFVEIDDNSTLKYETLNYQGTALDNAVDVTDMEWFHLDYWTDSATELKVSLISPGPQETPFTIEVTQDSWQSIDIPLTEYADIVDLAEVFQLKIEGSGTVYLDNLYFAKSPELTSAPEPTQDSTKVYSLFSNAYSNQTVDTWSAGWDQADVEDVAINGDDAKYYTNLNFAGIEFVSETIDGTDLTHLHMDILNPNPVESSSNLKVKLVDFGADGAWSGGDDVEHELTFNAGNTADFGSNTWIQLDIPLDDFENMTTKEHLAQLLFVNGSGFNEFYVDNLYFYGDNYSTSAENPANDLPTEVQLDQNYPNPFNPSTNIRYSLPEPADVRLMIYNSIGQQLHTLVDSRRTAGTHSVQWNASNLSSGIYFYQLKVGQTTIIRKMTLIK